MRLEDTEKDYYNHAEPTIDDNDKKGSDSEAETTTLPWGEGFLAQGQNWRALHEQWESVLGQLERAHEAHDTQEIGRLRMTLGMMTEKVVLDCKNNKLGQKKKSGACRYFFCGRGKLIWGALAAVAVLFFMF